MNAAVCLKVVLCTRQFAEPHRCLSQHTMALKMFAHCFSVMAQHTHPGTMVRRLSLLPR